MEVGGNRPEFSRSTLPTTGHGSLMQKSHQNRRLQTSMINSNNQEIKSNGASEEIVRFPKLNDCAHFHYEPSLVEIGPVSIKFATEFENEPESSSPHPLYDSDSRFSFTVQSNNRQWTLCRSYNELQEFDRQLHRCVFDRRNSHLQELPPVDHLLEISTAEIRSRLSSYFKRFSDIAGSLIICAPVLNWLEVRENFALFLFNFWFRIDIGLK